MRPHSLSSTQETSPHPSSVEVCLRPLIHRLDRHFDLTLKDTPFGNDSMIKEQIEARISLCDTVNFIVEKYDQVLTDNRGFNAKIQSSRFTSIDIFRARKTNGLMTHNHSKVENDIITGKYREVKS